MAPARSDELHRTLVDRVARRVEGRGVPLSAVDAAVGSVLAALARDERAASTAPAGELVAAVTAGSMPDLASRLRAALGRAGVSVGPIGIAAAGLHHVATLRLPAAARAQLDAAAATLGATVSVVTEDGAA
jgi:hypothetical protein